MRALCLLGWLGTCLLLPALVRAEAGEAIPAAVTTVAQPAGASLIASGEPTAVTSVAEPVGSSLTAAGEEAEAEGDTTEAYSENRPVEDFETHFLVSLPFTGVYSYLAVTLLDGLVQGTFPPEFRTADAWVVIGMALGSSLAVALGSAGRVPDQSQPRLQPASGTPGGSPPPDSGAAKLPLLKAGF